MHEPLHSRNLTGIASREVTTWRGTRLQGIYFVESTLPEAVEESKPAKGPIILAPGSWDAQQGEYSEALIRNLLHECGAPAVLELHYRFEGEDGFFEPQAFADDMAIIYSDRDAPPTIVGICFSCPFILEALLAACERETHPPIAGVQVVGHGVPGFLNKLGLFSLRALTNKQMAAASRHIVYSGHHHTSGNNVRGEAWFKNSLLVAAMKDTAPDGPVEAFPVPVETLYFEVDIATQKARKITNRIFGITEPSPRVKGSHRALRRRSNADEMIAAFYEKTQALALQRCASRGDASASAAPDATPREN